MASSQRPQLTSDSCGTKTSPMISKDSPNGTNNLISSEMIENSGIKNSCSSSSSSISSEDLNCSIEMINKQRSLDDDHINQCNRLRRPATVAAPSSSSIICGLPNHQQHQQATICRECVTNCSSRSSYYLNNNLEYQADADTRDCRQVVGINESGNNWALDSHGDCCRLGSKAKAKTKFEFGLLYCQRERLKLKDFSSEIRASMDVEQFVHQAEIMLDMTQVSVEDIVETMIKRVISTDQASSKRLSETRQLIFTPGSTMLLARTIQGVSCLSKSFNGKPTLDSCTFDYDQSWLCAICNLAQTSRRHMIIARFKQPINMGENAHEVKLFMLIVTPSKEKGTKNALDTGRTFATMLTDAQFRQKLLESKSQIEFKSLMMLKAQQLSKSTKQLKNRHKYMLDAAVNMSISSLNNLNPEFNNSSANHAFSCWLKSGNSGNNNNNNNRLGNKFTFVKADIKGGSTAVSAGGRQLFDKNPKSKLFELIHESGGDKDLIDGEDKVERKEDKNSSLSVSDGGCCHYLRKLFKSLEFGKGFWGDFKRRIKYYPDDFKAAFVGPPKTIQKTVATIWFLYFGILLPTIAFSALNTTQTNGHMGDLRKAIIGQAIGGLGFALLGGQPLVIIMTTAPLCLYTKDYGYHFLAMYAAVGIWNGFFLMIYSIFGFSKLMKWCTRSTEEIFALFIVIAFVTDASKDLMKNFNKYYYTPACQQLDLNQTTSFEPSDDQLVMTMTTTTTATSGILPESNASNDSMIAGLVSSTGDFICRRETSLLFVMLMLGTLWLATTLYRFNKTPYLEASKRELLADYALPTAVIVMSYVGSYVFDDIYVEKFPPLKDIRFERAKVELLPISGILISLGLGFTLSLLFFMDQNISAAMVNAPQNRLKKGCAYHFDLLVVGSLNVFLTFYGLPMMHGVLPHSPLHVRSLADIEERVEEGHLSEVIVNVRETRVTGIVSHILVLGSLLLIPYPIAYIPTAVLNGLFLYMAITSLDGLQLFERILLLFTEQSKYPPNHYIRRCPQRKIHLFTMLQLIQLIVMCLFGFSPFNIVEMFFPVIILLMIPFRHKVVSKYIDERYLDALDGKH